MKLHEILNKISYRLFHGSPYANIEHFRTDNLRNHTGTPGTLSFTTSIETAKIYGDYIYEAEVSGVFGDYLNPDDCQKNFDFRWTAIKNWHEKRNEHHVLDAARARLIKEITEGDYAQWENPAVWRACGWDGAWCHESGSRNLIVGKSAHIKLIGKCAHRNI